MGLSRLSNFLKNVKGNIIYVDPNSLDSTDNIENQGNSLTRPFKTVQRALMEAARFSYQRGKRNDRFLKTTILLYPGDHYIDNRPGWIPTGQDEFTLRNGIEGFNSIFELDYQSNFDILDSANDLYKMNSVYGGVIVPRGTSIVGLDLRKTKIRPLFIPDPQIDAVSRSAIFRVTGGCYFWQFTILDGDPNGLVFADYTGNQRVPNFSHHKLTVFEYADGVNPVKIDDDLLTYSTDRTDLQIYYEKIGLAYGAGSGRSVSPDYPSENIDIDPVVDEYRVVGSRGLEVGIETIRAGNGIIGSTEITVILDEPVPQLSVDTPIQISGISEPGYDGQYAVYEVIDDSSFKYLVATVPTNINPSASGATASITVDTVSSASPYIFNCSLRSVFGMCGLHADGKNATGFQSMVVAQFTGIGLQKDDNAFVRYDKTQGVYIEGENNAHTNSLSRFNPEYENYHIKASNNAFLQLVSVFAIGFANHFLAESGGDHSITNSNSNFGAKSLVSKGFRDEAFVRDDCGYITHVVTPKEIDTVEKSIEYLPIDVELTRNKNFSDRLYLFGEDDENNPPEHIIEGFRVGASKSSKLYLQVTDPTNGFTEVVSSEIVMGDTATQLAIGPIYNVVGEKRYRVGRSSVGINTIVNNIITLNEDHSFLDGESLLVFSNNQTLPDGIESGKLYYANVLTIRSLKLSRSKNGALNNEEDVVFNNKGGVLDLVSRVTDKTPGEPGSPFKWDGEIDGTSGKIRGWYILCNPFQNNIFTKIVQFYNASPVQKIGKVSSRTFIKRKTDNRSNLDKIYKFRYVLPKDNILTCRPPIDGYILQDSSSTNVSDSTELSKYFPEGTSQVLVNPTELRNPRYITNASWTSNTATIKTEIPHNLVVGSLVEIYNIISTNNLSGSDNKGFNGEYVVLNVIDSLTFTYLLTTDPGTFGNSINVRTPTSLPRYVNRKLNTTYQVFRSDEIQPYEKGKQDGIYHISVINSSNFPSVSPFTELSFSQPIQNLYPQLNKDNPNSDPPASHCFALPDPIGQVAINDPQRSITKETLDKTFHDLGFSFGFTNIIGKTGTGYSIYTSKDHNLNSVTEVVVTKIGDNFVDGTYYNVPLESASGKESVTGKNATAIVKVVNKQISSPITIISGGSAYGIGNTLTIKRSSTGEVLGISTDSNWVPSNFAYCTVSAINDSIGSVINVSGIASHLSSVENFNGNYVVTGVNAGESNIIQVESEKVISSVSSVGGFAVQNANATITGTVLNVNSFSYDIGSGIGTVGFTTSHSFRDGSSIRFYGANDSFYNNKNFSVVKVLSQVSVRVDMGKSSTTPVSGGSIKAFSPGYTSNRGDIDKNSEFTSARLIYKYDNFTDYVTSQLNATDLDTTALQLGNALNKGLNLGDYLLIDDEIVRISTKVTSNQIKIIRSVLGTQRQTHKIGTPVKRIKVFPVEFRRNSIIRASGHTFEYLGFGPGNYSTALPERQDRVLSAQEEILSQATKVDGGTILYSGMNSDGDFYNNNRKLTSTGKDQIFDAPIPTITGEEPQELVSDGGFNLITPQEAVISRSIKVEGGPELNLVSEFNGPVIFNEKIKSNSEFGLEVQKLKLRGDLEISRELTVSELAPTNAANIGDQVLNASPKSNSNIGWVYTDQNKWEKFGWINDKLYGVEVTTGNIQSANLVQKLKFQTSTLSITEQFDSATGITTIGLEQSVQAGNKIGIITGTSDTITNSILDTNGNPIPVINASPATGIANDYQKQLLKFVGSPTGFGFSIKVDYGSINDSAGNPVGLATLTFETPIRPINLGTGLGRANPSTGTTSLGTRIIYDNTLTSSLTNYAIGREGNVLWWSVPSSANSYGYKWFAGTTGIATFTALGGGTFEFQFNGDIKTSRNVEGSIIKSTIPTSSGLSPLDIQSNVQVSNLNASFVGGFSPSVSNTAGTIVVRNATTNIISGVCTGLTNGAGDAKPGSYYEDIVGRLGYTPFNKTSGDTITALSVFQQIADVYVSSVSIIGSEIEANFTNGPIAKVTGPLSDNLTLDIGSVPLSPNRSFNFTFIVDSSQSTTLTGLPVNLKINNTTVNLYWLNGNAPLGAGNAGQTVHVIGYTIFASTSSTVDRVIAVYGTYS